VLELDATGLAAAVRRGTYSPVEVVTAALQRIEEIEPQVNACTIVLDDAALRDARRAERTLAAGGDVGPLHGVPVVVKDEIWVRGAPATLASRQLEGFVPAEDAAAVRRLRDAGAIVIAKTTNPSYLWAGHTCSEMYGVTRNPRRLDRSPGGSSGGSAAAVAAHMAPLGLGSDAGGSVRIPASFCGLVGLKPTNGLVPRSPGFGGWRSLETFGPIARSVRDAALCLRVMAGPDASDELTFPAMSLDSLDDVGGKRLRGLRVAWSVDLGFAGVAEPVRDGFMRAIAALERAGWALEPAHPDLPSPEAIGTPTFLTEFPAIDNDRHDLLEPVIRDLLTARAGVSARAYYDAQLARSQYARVWEQFFETYSLLLTPTVPMPPFAAHPTGPVEVNGRPVDIERDWWWHLSLTANLAGEPAISVPIGTDRDALPLGLQITGPRFADARCLHAAAAVEQLMPQAAPPLTAARDPHSARRSS
jgi:Asp-tRNA(Asn)/Glu-tRNA(Gln) amidotransferase A subunit family amidase